MIAFSSDGATRLSTSATAAGPPDVDSPCAGARSVSVRIDRSMSTSMSGDTFSIRAIRNTTSAPNTGSSSLSTDAVCCGSRCARMSATVCGCSPRSMLPSCCGSALRRRCRPAVFGDLCLDALEHRLRLSARRTRSPALRARTRYRRPRSNRPPASRRATRRARPPWLRCSRDPCARSRTRSARPLPAASFCVISDAASEPSTMHRIATFWVPLSCSSWCVRASVLPRLRPPSARRVRRAPRHRAAARSSSSRDRASCSSAS